MSLTLWLYTAITWGVLKKILMLGFPQRFCFNYSGEWPGLSDFLNTPKQLEHTARRELLSEKPAQTWFLILPGSSSYAEAAEAQV